MIRLCNDEDFNSILVIINDAARAYKSHIPEDCYQNPYFTDEYLRHELADCVVFWGYEIDNELIGVMGIQDVNDVTLIRHAYVKTSFRKRGIGNALIKHLLDLNNRTKLIGTWKAATWAISFYEKNGFAPVAESKNSLLFKKYWKISERQIETSVVLADSSFIVKS